MTDVLILGDGPAGLAAAITLRQSGFSVMAVARGGAAPERVGESLAPSALQSLRILGVADRFLQEAHPVCLGNCSCWGTPDLHYFDFIQSQHGSGWYPNRRQFDALLRSRAAALGVRFATSTAAASLSLEAEGVTLYPGAGAAPLAARFVLDCTGRQAWLGRQLGIDRVQHDQQVAIIGRVRLEGAVPHPHHSLVEAVEDGWWYVAPANAHEAVCIFFTDADLNSARRLQMPGVWVAKKAATRFVRHRVPGDAASLLSLRSTAAGSSMLSQLYGTTWAAAGDAACSFDPLSSHGVSFALASGIDAGRAAAAHLAGDSRALQAYEQKIFRASSIYLRERSRVHATEQRWPDAPYWQRRHAAVQQPEPAF